MPLDDVRLEDRHERHRERLLLTGGQALVRALLTRSWLDEAAGQATGGFVSGYRGSPLGGFDRDLAAARAPLEARNIRFRPGVNEELAATAVWGSQQVGLFEGARVAGVFGLWYGKGPGVDRSGDAFKHANLAGTAPLGGVLAVAGDDHAGISSTTAHQSEFAFVDAQIPVLAPAGVQDVLDLAVAGWAMSRASGCWVALKCPSEVIEQAATVDAGLARYPFADAATPDIPGGLHIRWPDRLGDQERRLAGPKPAAARAFAKANGLDRMLWRTPGSRIGIVAAGKAWADAREALTLLGIGEAEARDLGLCLLKPALVWPLDAETVRAFAHGLAEILVVEEKRPLIEPQLRDLLYDAPTAARPRILGKTGQAGALLPAAGVLTPRLVAGMLRARLGLSGDRAGRGPAPVPEAPPPPAPALRRPPHFCPGCPHNTSTRVPEGSRALAGIGCHTLALWSDPNTLTLTQMGGEGATWIGQAPFTETGHVFANLGDGTYYHSGLLAIRAAIAAGVDITYKLLFNDAVAMTGGQKVEGGLSVPAIARELAAEGVARIVVVAEEPGRYPRSDPFPADVAVMGRDGFDCAQAELANAPGVSVLIFDQVCAAEKRRRRRRGTLEDPARHVFINELVCEGCGDCQRASHCLSVVPVATEFGEKRRIDPASCNKDETCLNGFCPALVTVEGGRPRRHVREGPPEVPAHLATLPAPAPPALGRPWRGLVAGIGGTGVVTVGRLIALGAHLDGRAAVVLDQTGLAQKGGAVASHVTLAAADGAIHAARIGDGQADLVIGCDLVVAADTPQLGAVDPGRTAVVLNTEETITGAFLTDPDRPFPAASLLAAVTGRAGREHVTTADAIRLAARLTGEAMAANVLLLGLAWQKGLVPVSEAALLKAIELNGTGAATNREAFLWGRRAALDLAAVRGAAGLEADEARPPAPDLEAIVARRADFLAGYGGPALARRYRQAVDAVARLERRRAPGRDGLARAVALSYFRLLAAKDEYEVARLFTDGSFDAALAGAFEGDYRVHYHMAPPLIAGRDPLTGRPRKRRFGPAFRGALRAVAALRPLRGTMLDPFRGTADRRLERAQRAEYEGDLERIGRLLASGTHGLCQELLSLPLSVRGFGHVKETARAEAARRRRDILGALERAAAGRSAAE